MTDTNYAKLGETFEGSILSYAALPPEQLEQNDVYALFAFAGFVQAQEDTYRYIERTSRTAENFILPLPTPLGRVTATWQGGEIQTQWTAYPGGVSGYFLYYDQGEAQRRSYNIFSDQRGSTARSSDYTLPDFTDLEGWQQAWSLSEDEAISWDVTAYRRSGEFGEDNYELINASRSGTIRP